ncbi:MAG: sigma-70 family RNA polymerase sigma factor, partial [Bacteroidales bacterium]|nr:sigma-70 family RNA polymerase sigma factor [Bacteroidales bacterium]
MPQNKYLQVRDQSEHKGDDSMAVLESIFTAFYPVLAAYCNKYVRDAETARDIVQDIFLKVWEQRQTVDFSIPLHSYLLKLAHNSCMNHLQRQKIEEKYLHSAAAQLLEMEAQYDTLFDQLAADAMQERIEQTVEQLPAQCRDIFRKSR